MTAERTVNVSPVLRNITGTAANSQFNVFTVFQNHLYDGVVTVVCELSVVNVCVLF